MEQVASVFSDKFKLLWESGSKSQILYDTLEGVFFILKEMSVKQTSKQAQLRSSDEIEREMSARSRSMWDLGVEILNLQWNRIILRSQLKVLDSLSLFFYSSNTWNAYGCALSLRCIIEHVALLQYLANEAFWRDRQPFPKDVMIEFIKLINKMSYGSRFDWEKMFSNERNLRKMLLSGKYERPGDQRIPRSSDLIKALDDALIKANKVQAKGEIRFLYAISCDVIHPSWGGDFIYSTDMYGDMAPTKKLEEQFKLSATLFCLPIVPLVTYFCELCQQLEKDELKKIDLIEERENSKTVKNSNKKIGRNKPCPCGSGRKYKKCCGKS